LAESEVRVYDGSDRKTEPMSRELEITESEFAKPAPLAVGLTLNTSLLGGEF